MFQRDPYRNKTPISTDKYDDGSIPSEDLPNNSKKKSLNNTTDDMNKSNLTFQNQKEGK